MGNQVDLTLRIGSELAGLKQAHTELQKFFAQFKAGFNLNLGAKLADVVTGIPRATLNSLREYSQLTEKIVGETERARGAVGISATAYQVFANTLEEADQEASALIPSLSLLSRVIGEAATGSTTAAAKLGAIGVTANQLKGLAPERQFELIVRRLANLTDANVRDAAAADLLGRSYQNLKPLIESLARDGYDGLARKVESTTGLISNEHARAIDDAGDRSEAAGKRIAAALAPALSKWKEMVATAKEYAANLIAGTPAAPAAKTAAEIGAAAAREEARGKSVAALDALISKELKAFQYINDYTSQSELLTGMTADQYISVISARVTAFEEARAQAQADLDAADARNNPLSPNAYAQGARDSRSSRLRNQQSFEERMKQLTAQARAEDERRAKQDADLEFSRQQSAYAREIAKIEATAASVESNRFLTANQKAIALQPLLREENRLIADRIALLQTELELNTFLTPAERQQLQDRIDALQRERTANQNKQTSTSPLGFRAQLGADLVKLRDQFGTTAQQISGFITNSIGTAIDGISDGIYGLITRTKSWGEVGRQVGAQMLQSLIKTGVQMTANALLGQATQRAAQATAATTGPAIAASYAPASASVNTATYGSSATAGAIATVAAVAAIIALLARGYSTGGHVTGPGTGTSDSILARLSNDEFVMRASTVRSLGLGRMDYINRTGRLPGFSTGGPVFPSSALSSTSSPSSASSTLPPMYFYGDEKEATRAAMARGDYDAEFIKMRNRTSHR